MVILISCSELVRSLGTYYLVPGQKGPVGTLAWKNSIAEYKEDGGHYTWSMVEEIWDNWPRKKAVVKTLGPLLLNTWKI